MKIWKDTTPRVYKFIITWVNFLKFDHFSLDCTGIGLIRHDLILANGCIYFLDGVPVAHIGTRGLLEFGAIKVASELTLEHLFNPTVLDLIQRAHELLMRHESLEKII